MTAQDFIYQALRKVGQLRPGYTSQAELLNDALVEWQAMYDGFNAERTLNFTMPDYIFPITGPGHGTTGNAQTFFGTGYEIGPSASDFVAPRPVAIVKMNLYETQQSPTNPTRIPIQLISMEQWLNIATIGLTPINVATVAAYDPQYPNGVIWVWPPLNGNSLEIFTWGQLTPPASLGATYAAPPGYQDLIVYRLAQRLYHMVTKDVCEHPVNFTWLCGQAEIAAERVRRVNAPMPKLRCDFVGGSRNSPGTSDWQLLLSGIPY